MDNIEKSAPISDHEIGLELLGYAHHLCKESSGRESKLELELMWTTQKLNEATSFIEWTKEAFGYTNSEDFGGKLSFFIDDFFKEKEKDEK